MDVWMKKTVEIWKKGSASYLSLCNKEKGCIKFVSILTPHSASKQRWLILKYLKERTTISKVVKLTNISERKSCNLIIMIKQNQIIQPNTSRQHYLVMCLTGGKMITFKTHGRIIEGQLYKDTTKHTIRKVRSRFNEFIM